MVQTVDRGPETLDAAVAPEHSKSVVMRLAGPVTLSKAGIVFPHNLAQHVWEEIGLQLHEASNSSAWWLADWLIFGEATFSGRYREAIKRTGLDYQTLRNYAWVARKFPHERRVESLSIAHHAEVARLSEPEQDYWLRKAGREQWSRNRLRREVRASLAEREREREGGAGEPSRVDDGRTAALEVLLSPDQLDCCVRIADSCGLTVNEWVADVLRSAAQSFAVEVVTGLASETATEGE
ncbi:LmbU family transcriptional regulator [Micromonospora sp. CA-248089]|uniref:LmbU family transcriptional regulator n=1 Tax=Micromonospora sp. CA-248089 TaxID=3239960 RepID=UPI003D90B0C4